MQGYFDFDRNYEVVDQDLTSDLNTIIAQLERWLMP